MTKGNFLTICAAALLLVLSTLTVPGAVGGLPRDCGPIRIEHNQVVQGHDCVTVTADALLIQDTFINMSQAPDTLAAIHVKDTTVPVVLEGVNVFAWFSRLPGDWYHHPARWEEAETMDYALLVENSADVRVTAGSVLAHAWKACIWAENSRVSLEQSDLIRCLGWGLRAEHGSTVSLYLSTLYGNGWLVETGSGVYASTNSHVGLQNVTVQWNYIGVLADARDPATSATITAALSNFYMQRLLFPLTVIEEANAAHVEFQKSYPTRIATGGLWWWNDTGAGNGPQQRGLEYEYGRQTGEGPDGQSPSYRASASSTDPAVLAEMLLPPEQDWRTHANVLNVELCYWLSSLGPKDRISGDLSIQDVLDYYPFLSAPAAVGQANELVHTANVAGSVYSLLGVLP